MWGGLVKATGFRYLYGPVNSRRLGRSLGIDLVPFKVCTYDCIYCQLGRTTRKTVQRQEYFPVVDILRELEQKLAASPSPDYLTLAGSGEPTLNNRIGELISKIKSLTRIPVAVLTNGSLLWQPEVQEALMAADLVIPSLDAGDEHLFRYVNRPHRNITFDRMVNGLAAFTRDFPGAVWLEVFLLTGITGIKSEVEKIAALAKSIKPGRVQLNTVSRPTAEEFASPVPEEQMRVFAQMFDLKVEVITQEEPLALSSPTNGAPTDAEILALLSRRPSSLHGVAAGLGMHVGEAIKRLQALSEQGEISAVRLKGAVFYERKSRPH